MAIDTSSNDNNSKRTRRPFFYYYSGFALLCSIQQPNFSFVCSLSLHGFVSQFRLDHRKSYRAYATATCVWYVYYYSFFWCKMKKGLHCHKHRCQQSIHPFFHFSTFVSTTFNMMIYTRAFKKRTDNRSVTKKYNSNNEKHLFCLLKIYKFEMKKNPD